jgi:hypothetical protein
MMTTSCLDPNRSAAGIIPLLLACHFAPLCKNRKTLPIAGHCMHLSPRASRNPKRISPQRPRREDGEENVGQQNRKRDLYPRKQKYFFCSLCALCGESFLRGTRSNSEGVVQKASKHGEESGALRWERITALGGIFPVAISAS